MKKILRIVTPLVIGALVPLLAISPANAASDLIGYWNFDEASGLQFADASPNANQGTVIGSGVAHSTDLPPTTCFVNTHSVSFDGSGGYVSIDDNATMDPTSAISISFWMKANTVSNGYQHIIFKQGPVVTSYGVWLNNDHIYMEDNDDTVRSLSSNATISVGDWHYISVTYDGTDQKLYIDGMLDNSQSIPGVTLTYTNSPVKIGAGDYNNPFSGFVDDMRIYNRALTAQEIADLASGGCGPGVAAAQPSQSHSSSGSGTAVVAGVTTAVTSPDTGYGTPRGMSTGPFVSIVGGSTLVGAGVGLILRRRLFSKAQ